MGMVGCFAAIYAQAQVMRRITRSHGSIFAAVAFVSAITATPVAALAEQAQQDLKTNEKILGLSSIWMEVRRDFPFRERLDDWDSDYLASIDAVSATIDMKSYYRELQLFVAKLKDGHTFVILPKGMSMTKSRPSIGVRRVGKDAMVDWVRSDLIDRIPLGSVVEKVDGQTYEVAANKATATVFASSTQARMDDAYVLAMEGEKNSVVDLQILTPQGEARTISLTRGQEWPEGTTLIAIDQDPDDSVSFKWLKGHEVAYLSINSFNNEEIYQKFLKYLPPLRSARYVVIDLRANSGGNDLVAYNVLSHFLTKPVKTNASTEYVYSPSDRAKSKNGTSRYLNSPANIGVKAVAIPPDIVRPSTPSTHLNGKLAILTGHGTISAAEDFLVTASTIKHVRIGEITAGSTGQPVSVKLPGGGAAYILSKKDTYPSGKEFVDTGISPNIEISPTIDDLRSGHDVVVERMLQLIQEGKI